MARIRERSSLVLKRLTEGDYDEDGNYVEGSTKNINIKCSIQPFRSGRNQMTLPEGYREEDTVIVFTQTPINTVKQSGPTNADYTTIDGLKYVALTVFNWKRDGMRLGHYKVLFVKESMLLAGDL